MSDGRNWYGRSKKSYRKRKKYDKRKKIIKKYTPRYKNIMPVTGFPDVQMVRIRYVEQVAINPPAATFLAHQMRANSIFDPNFTGGGHQPLGHDEWGLVYRRYEVIESSIKATFYAPITLNNGTDNYMVALELDDTTSYPANPTTHMEGGRTKAKLLIAGYNSQQPITLTKKFKATKHFGPKKDYDHDQNRADFGGNPTQQFTFHCLAAAADGATDAAQINLLVQMEYICKLSERVDLAQS